MRFLRIAPLLLLTLLCICARAQAPADTGSFRIAGTVVNSATGAAVPNASVSILSEDNSRVVATVLSGTDGSFAFDHVAAGKYPLTASKRGFHTGFYEQHDEFSTAIVAGEGQDTEHLLFHLNPNAVIAGTITADGGDPVERASVMLFRTPVSAGQPPQLGQHAFTDDTGAYEFVNLAPGEYFVAVQANPWYAVRSIGTQKASGERSPLDVAYPVTFFDSATQESAATPITLGPGERAQADISLHAVPALHLKLNQSTRPGAGIANVQQVVFGAPLSAGGFYPVGGAEPNSVAGGLAPGRYLLNYGDPPRTAEINATSDAEIAPDSGAPTVSITGRVRFMEGDASNIPMVVLVPGGDSRSANPIPAPMEQNQFRAEAVPPGIWSVHLQGVDDNGHMPQVVSIESGGVSTTGNQITVADRPLSVVVTATGSTSTIRGFARQGDKPAVAVSIFLAPHDPHAWPSQVRRDQSDSDGSFVLRDVPPGQYTVVAIKDGWKLNWRSYRDLARFLPRGVNVNVTEHSGPLLKLPQPVQATEP